MLRCVALRKESVDRNNGRLRTVNNAKVALRKESVDRNIQLKDTPKTRKVALRKESVDRNFYYADKDADWVRSLSARRAWIEIRSTHRTSEYVWVALRKESVDRN